LLFRSQVTLEHYEAPLPDYSLEPYAATWPFAYTNEEASDLVNARSRQYPDDDVDVWARRFIAPGGKTGTMALLRAMTLHIKNEFFYVRRTEKRRQPPRRHAAPAQRQLPRLCGADDGRGALARSRRALCQRATSSCPITT